MFLKKLKALFIIAIALSSIQCDDFSECPEGEKNSGKCWQVEIVSCEGRVKSEEWSCNADCVCENAWHVRDADNKCIPVWKCPGICPPNSHFLHCTRENKTPYIEPGYTLAEFEELCQRKCTCDEGFALDPDGKTECVPSESDDSVQHNFPHFG